MRKITFEKSSFLLAVIFLVSASLLFFLMVLAYKHLERQAEIVNLMKHSYEVSSKLESVYSNLKDIETERRNFIISESEDSKDRIKEKIKLISTYEQELYENFKDNLKQKEQLDELHVMLEYKYDIISESFVANTAVNDDVLALKNSLMSGKNVMMSIQKKIDEMLSLERINLENRKSEFSYIQKSTPLYLFIISIFSLGLLVFTFHKINKDVKVQKKNNDELKLALYKSQLAEGVGGFGVWSYDYSTKKFSFSDNHYQILGFNPGDCNEFYDLLINSVHAEDVKMVIEKTNEMIDKGNVEPFRYRVIRNDGQQRHFQVLSKSISISSGNRLLLGITTDITSEIENQLKLEGINWILTERNKSLSVSNETFIEAEKIGLFGTCQYLMRDNEFLFSDNLVRLFGYSPDEDVSHPSFFKNVVHPQDLRMVEIKVASILASRPVQPFTFRIYRNSDKKLCYIQVNSKIIQDREVGDYYLFIAQDSTDEILDKANIREKNRILEANNKELQAFNYVASHDLQEPLRKIETFISRLIEKDFEQLSDSGKQYVEKMQSSANRMRNLITDLLQFSRTTRAEQVFEMTNLNFILSSALDDLYYVIEESEAQISHTKFPMLKVVPFQIQQLFINLISNSIKYRKADVKPEITIRVERVKSRNEIRLSQALIGNYYKFTFSDNGIGFEQKYSDKIFQLFNRLHSKGEYEGTGIGLAICKKIVENHKGYIFADSTLDVGSVFTIYLPEII